MKNACSIVFILWLLLATQYWNKSHSVNSHNQWVCFVQTCSNNEHINVSINQIICYDENDGYLCSNNKNHAKYINNNHNKQGNIRLYTSSLNHSNQPYLHDNVIFVTKFLSKNVLLAIKCYVNYPINVCLITNSNFKIYMILELHTFFFTTNPQQGPQPNLWNEGVVKVIREKLAYGMTYKCCFVLHSMEASPKTALTSKKLFDDSEMIEVGVQNKKRSSDLQILSSQKKVKGKEIAIPRPSFWLGFHALNLLAKENNQPMEPSHSVSKLVRMGVSHDEALDCIMSEPTFPYVLQEEWPSKRMDGKEGNHYNLTQLPHEIEVDEYGFALDYHVAILFELEDIVLLKDDVMNMVVARLKHMHIEVGSILGEPIAIMCYHGSKRWSGAVKIHLKDPQTDGCGLLQGVRPFILKLDEQTIRRGKVCKTFDSIAIASLLSIRVNSISLKGIKWHHMYE